MDCIFCKIVRGEIPAAKIYEDGRALAFLDINPVTDGHALLIPKEHYEMMVDVPDELLSSLFVTVKKLMIPVRQAMGSEYVAVSVAGTEVPHFHIHIIPRSTSDGLAGFWPTKKYADGEMTAIAEKIRRAIGS